MLLQTYSVYTIVFIDNNHLLLYSEIFYLGLCAGVVHMPPIKEGCKSYYCTGYYQANNKALVFQIFAP